MNRLFTIRFFLKSLFFVLLLGFYGTSMVHYCYRMINAEMDALELCDASNGDSEEKEKKSEEEIDHKIYIDFYFLDLVSAHPEMKIWLSAPFCADHHPEIPTRPPRPAISFS